MPRILAAVLTLVIASTPSSLAAQSLRLTVDAFGGAFIPATDLFNEVFPDVGALSLSQKTAFSVGGRVAVWPSRRIGIEAEGIYAFSDVEVTCVLAGVCADEGTAPANVFLTSLSLLYTFIDPPLDPVAVFVSAGVGLVARGGDAFTDVDESTDLAGVFGLGLRYGIAPGVRIRGDVKDYISSFEWKEVTVPLKERGLDVGATLQQDILVTLAVEFVLGGS